MIVPEVIFEDNHLLGVNKPAGWLVQGDHTGDTPLIDWAKAYIKEKYDKPGAVFLGCIHRIDRPVSGVVLFARTSKALERMNQMLSKGEIKKTYIAVTCQKPLPTNGELVHFLAKDNERNRSFVVPESQALAQSAKKCTLSYETVKESHKGATLVRVKPQTGRPHQIRVQLATIGAPIFGDVKYQAPYPLPDLSIALHCLRMEFVHPVLKTQTEVQVLPLAKHVAFAPFEKEIASL
jgi:23S rRNA pseudouridine1911/1915/1917 synthase